VKKNESVWKWLLPLSILALAVLASCNIDGAGSMNDARGASPLAGTWHTMGAAANKITFGTDGKVSGQGIFATGLEIYESVTWSAELDDDGESTRLTLVITPKDKDEEIETVDGGLIEFDLNGSYTPRDFTDDYMTITGGPFAGNYIKE
jgi:hypothetical protein